MEERVKKTKSNFMHGVMVLMFSQVIIKIVGLIYKLYLTNKEGFGDEGNAIYSAGFQIYALLLTISSVGVPNAISKLVSAKVAIGDNKGAYRIFKIAFAIFGLLGFFGTVILFVGAEKIANEYLQIPEARLSLLALAPSVFLVSVSSVLRGYFNGREKIAVTAHSQSIEQIVKTVFTVAIVEVIGLISMNNTIVMAAGATIATTLATATSLIYLYIYHIRRKKSVWSEVLSSKIYRKESILKIIKSILAVSIPISLGGMLSVANKTVDALTVIRIAKKFIGEETAKIQYGILSGKVETLVALPYSFNIAFATALVPAISGMLARGERIAAEKRIKFSMLAAILIGLPCTALMAIFAGPILHLLFPNASSGEVMLQLSSISIIFVVLTQTINGALQGIGKVVFPTIALGIGLMLKFIFNVILINISSIGVNGAIISSIISHFSILFLSFIYLKKKMSIKFEIDKFLFKPIIATVIMGAVSFLAYINLKFTNNINLIISIFLGIIIYIFAIIILRIFSKEEIYMIPYGQKLYKKMTKKA